VTLVAVRFTRQHVALLRGDGDAVRTKDRVLPMNSGADEAVEANAGFQGAGKMGCDVQGRWPAARQISSCDNTPFTAAISIVSL